MKSSLVMMLALAACGSKDKPPGNQPGSGSATARPAPGPTPEMLVTGPLPEGPEAGIAHAKCQLCHTEQYLVEQRLSPDAWKKTLAKMKKFGAPITDDEEARLATWLASLYTPELPIREAKLVERPALALPPSNPTL